MESNWKWIWTTRQLETENGFELGINFLSDFTEEETRNMMESKDFVEK